MEGCFSRQKNSKKCMAVLFILLKEWKICMLFAIFTQTQSVVCSPRLLLILVFLFFRQNPLRKLPHSLHKSQNENKKMKIKDFRCMGIENQFLSKISRNILLLRFLVLVQR